MKTFYIQRVDSSGKISFVYQITKSYAYTTDEYPGGIKFDDFKVAKVFCNHVAKLETNYTFNVVTVETIITVEEEKEEE